MSAPRAILIGPPGSGKSAVAVALAAEWGVPARDTDADIVEADGRDIPTIFVESGEEEFRRLERAAVAAALAEHGGVLAVGGGAVLDPATQADIEAYAAGGGEVVFLDVGLHEAARRVGLTASRPLLAGSPRARWAQLMEERRGIYEHLATRVIRTDDLTPRKVARAIVGMEDAT